MLPVEAGDKHGPAMLFAARLVAGDKGRLISSRSGIAHGFAEAALAELVGAAEKFDRIVDVERGKQEFHRPIVLVAQRQDVRPHGPILASAAKQNPRTPPAGIRFITLDSITVEEFRAPPRNSVAVVPALQHRMIVVAAGAVLAGLIGGRSAPQTGLVGVFVIDRGLAPVFERR